MANQNQQDNKSHNPQGHNQFTQQKQQEQSGSLGNQQQGSGIRGGSHDQHVKSGQQSHKKG